MRDIKDGDSTGETGVINGKISTKKLRKFIVKSIVQPAYVKDIRDILSGRYRWRKIGKLLLIISLLLSSSSTILTFMSAYFDEKLISIIAGGIGVLGAIFLHFSLMSKRESKRLTHQANEILKQLGIEGVPDIESNDIENNVSNNNIPYEANDLNKKHHDFEYDKLEEIMKQIDNELNIQA